MAECKRFSIDRQQAAYLLGVDARTVTRWQTRETDPLPVQSVGRSGQQSEYDPAAVMAWRLRDRLRERVADSGGDHIDYEVERARLTKEQADSMALKNAVTRREQAPVQLLSLALDQLGGQIVALLQAIPAKLKNRCPHLGSTEIDIVQREIVKALNSASKASIDFDALENAAS